MNKFIKILSILFVLSTFLFSGCSKIDSNPKDVLSKYLDAIYYGTREEAYQYISEKDKATKDLQKYLVGHATVEQEADKYPMVGREFVEVFFSKLTYEIKEIKVTGNQAKAEVTITAPDFASMFTNVMGAAFMSAFAGEKSAKEMEKMVAENYKDKKMPMMTEIQFFDLVKETEGWRVFLNWETKDKIDSAMEQARHFEKEKKLYDAKEKYQQVLELDSEVVEASRKIKELDNEIKSFKEKQDYISKVRLYAFEAKYYSSYRDEKVPGVKFKLQNGGNKTLTKIKVTVYFKDALGNIIAEEDYHPVLVSKYSFGEDKPLKPNYIWQMESGRFYRTKSVPSEWQEGNAIAQITDIEFEE